MPTATVVGPTGLVGSHILNTLLPSPAWTNITTISRRAPKVSPPGGAPQAKLTTLLAPTVDEWPSLLPTPASTVLFSGLGTTRAAAGSLANQWKIDHDANVALCRAAKAGGVKTFVFISAAGTRSFLSSMAPYSKMKNGVEDAVREAGFENAIIVRPGLIMGQREEARLTEGMAQTLARALGCVSTAAKDAFSQEASVIGTAAVRAAELALEGKAPSSYWILESADIMKYGRPEAETATAPTAAPAAAAPTEGAAGGK